MQLEEMIRLLNVDLRNEWKHLHFYLACASRLTGLHATEYKEYFLKAAQSEMGHVTAFTDLIIGLGGVPIHEPAPYDLFDRPGCALKYALAMEEDVVANYVQRQKDAARLAEFDPTNAGWIDVFLDGQIQDSRQDADHLKQIIKGLHKPTDPICHQ